MKNIIGQIDLERYFKLVTLILPDIESFNVFDWSGGILWSNTEIDSHLPKAVQYALHLYNKQENHPNVFTARLNQQQLLTISVLNDVAEEPYGGVAIFLKPNCSIEHLREKVILISSILAREIGLISELESMSGELEERYEELNLVYDTDEQPIESVSGNEVLEQLVNNCTDYLDVAMTALLLPKEELTIFSVSSTNKIHYVNSLLVQLKNYCYPWIEKHAHSIVSNDLADAYRHDVFPDIPYKIICSPILVAENTVGGIMVTLNPHHARDFSNSDRNLLEAMAKKAAKVAMTNYDRHTGLLKRKAYEVFLEKALKRSRSDAKNYCLLHIDLDGTKIVNDTISSEAGDQVILEVAKLVRDKVRDTDIVARLMGDKFGVLLDACSLETGCSIADNIRKSIQDLNFSWHEQAFEISACIGVASLNADSDNIQSVIAATELATNIAKENGRNIVQVYQQADTVLQRRKGEVFWIREIQKALKLDNFKLFAQPIQPINSESGTTHFEILLRLINESGEIIMPNSFIPAAERYRLITAIDEWVVANVFKVLKENFECAKNYLWTINLSGLSIDKKEFAQNIIELQKKYQVPENTICFEITETIAMNNLEGAISFIDVLRDKGFKFALDDFGTGTSTFTYLKQLPVDYLKIDGTFIKDIVTDSFAKEIVTSIQAVSHVRGIQTIAEFVENEGILQSLSEIGVNYAQGYHIDKPKPIEEVIQQLNSRNENKLAFKASA